MTQTEIQTVVDPNAVAAAVVRAASQRADTVAIFAESSSAMFYGARALSALEDAPCPYYQMSVQHGSMGHALGGAVGFCVATGQRAIVLTGDGSMQLLNPLPTAVKHGCAITIVVLNDSRLGLPFFGSARVGAFNAQATTDLEPWDFTRTGSARVGGRRVSDASALDNAMEEALSFDGCFVVDVAIDPRVAPPVGERFDSVDKMFGDVL